MTEAEARKHPVNPFDLTKVWPHADFPLMEIGRLELNRNVENYFAETEQAAFAPSNLVPGTGVSPDRMLQARLLAYQDAHRHRIGANANQIPVNAPRCPVHHYQRDGVMAGMCPARGGSDNQGSGVNFYPNDRTGEGAPAPQPGLAPPPLPMLEQAWIRAYDTEDEDHYSQAGDLFRLMSDEQRRQLAHNIAEGLVQAGGSVRERMLNQFSQADPDYARRVSVAMESMGPHSEA
jgi:catalase